MKSLKIVLILPPNKYSIPANMPSLIDKQRGFTPPLGLLYIASYLKKYTNHEVKIIDCQAENIDYNNLKQIIVKLNPDIVGISAMTFALIDVIKTISLVKSINNEIKIILGGIHANLYPNETINLPGVDYVVLGEGEITFTKLIQNMNSPEKVRGIVFKSKNKIINTGPPELIKNLDELPFPDRDLIKKENYYTLISKKQIVTSMITSRGCPFNCIFCHRPQMGRIFRARSPKNVVDEIELCKSIGIDEILVYDDTFTVDKKRVFDICKEIRDRKIDIAWDVRSRVDTVNKDLIFSLANAGCKKIHFGIESGSQRILDILKKEITLQNIKDAFKWSKQAKLETLAYLMLGNPTETKQDIMESIKFAKSLKPDYLHIAITTPYPSTKLYDMALKQKVIDHDYWKEFAENPTQGFIPKYWEENFTHQELNDIIKKAYKSFYLNPRCIAKKILSLRSFNELKKLSKAAISLVKM